MAEITINVPDAVVPRVLDAFADEFGYDPEIDGTKAAFAKQRLASYVKQIVVNHEAETAARQAQTAACDAAIAEINIT